MNYKALNNNYIKLGSHGLTEFDAGVGNGPNVLHFSNGHVYSQYTLWGIQNLQIGACYSMWPGNELLLCGSSP